MSTGRERLPMKCLGLKFLADGSEYEGSQNNLFVGTRPEEIYGKCHSGDVYI